MERNTNKPSLWWIKDADLDLEVGDEIDLDASGKSEYLGLKVTKRINTNGLPINWGDTYNDSGTEATISYKGKPYTIKLDDADGLLKCMPLLKSNKPILNTDTSDGACWTARDHP